jgi:glycosyltransferase involved in cell wall biosynthesis
MITATVLTKNSELYIEKVLEALKRFPEVLIYDSGSEDKTLQIAERFPNVIIHKGKFDGFGKTHNVASSLAQNDWILSIDSDEIVSTELTDEIFNLTLDNSTVYSFSRHNYYRKKFIKGCGWYPDRVFRLYNRKTTSFTNALVHEAIIVDNLKTYDFKGPVMHFPYKSIQDFLSKMQLYSTLFAEQYKGKRKSSTAKALSRGLFSFFKSYFLKRGFLLGSQGFEISAYNGITAYYKYLKLRDANEG